MPDAPTAHPKLADRTWTVAYDGGRTISASATSGENRFTYNDRGAPTSPRHWTTTTPASFWNRQHLLHALREYEQFHNRHTAIGVKFDRFV